MQTLGAAVSETVTATDLVSAILAAAAAITDAATATDATTSSLNGNVYSADVSESATSTDTVAAVAQMVAQIAESASSGDAYAVAANLVALLTETGSPADVVAVPGGYSRVADGSRVGAGRGRGCCRRGHHAERGAVRAWAGRWPPIGRAARAPRWHFLEDAMTC